MARGQAHLPQRPSASCPTRPCCLLYCLISFFSRLSMTSGTSRSAMTGMHPNRPLREGLELALLWFLALLQLSSVTRLRVLTLVPAVSSFLVSVLKMPSNLMQCLMSWLSSGSPLFPLRLHLQGCAGYTCITGGPTSSSLSRMAGEQLRPPLIPCASGPKRPSLSPGLP